MPPIAHDPAAGADVFAGVQTLCELFQATVARVPDTVAVRVPGGTQEITWAQYGDRVRSIAGALAALGVGHGDTVALMLANRPEFALVDTAAMHLGATPFSVYNTLPAAEIAFLFANAGNRVVVCEAQFAERVLAAAQGTAVEHVLCVDGAPSGTRALAEAESAATADGALDFDATWRAVSGDDVLTLIYTSGTTGPPKGVELTHANLLAELRGTHAVLPLEPGDRTVSFLPSAHIADRWATYYQSFVHGMTVTCVADATQLLGALLDARPTIWGAVPRIWEKFKAALEAGPPAAEGEDLLERIGLDQARWIIVGAAPTPPAVLEFFAGLGLPILELWGMSETSCCVTINPRSGNRIGTVGLPVPGARVRLADDGELEVHGELVMRGYRGQPEKTAETMTPDGWLRTGDIAQIDDDGFVRIVDRKKELIINAAGKNMSPANIESHLKSAHPLIGQALCIGDARPYNVALLVLDPDAAAAYVAEHGPDGATAAGLAECDDVRAVLEEAVREANGHLARVEQIKRFVVLAGEWLPGGEELTPTMKLKRKPIAAKYAEQIEALYR